MELTSVLTRVRGLTGATTGGHQGAENIPRRVSLRNEKFFVQYDVCILVSWFLSGRRGEMCHEIFHDWWSKVPVSHLRRKPLTINAADKAGAVSDEKTR